MAAVCPRSRQGLRARAGQGGGRGGQGGGAGGFWIRGTVGDEGVGEREGGREIRINRIVPCFGMLYVL